MREPHTLDPPNGDYVKYIEAIQQGKIRPQGGLVVGPLNNAPTNPAKKSDNTTARMHFNEAVLRSLAIFLVLGGIVSLAYGVLVDFEPCIPIGMFTLFAGFVFNMSLSK